MTDEACSRMEPLEEIRSFYHRAECAGDSGRTGACSCGLSQLVAQLETGRPMSDEFWISFGFMCGGTIGNTVRFGEERTSIAIRHIECVMRELLDRFPNVMFPLKRYVRK